MVQSPIATAADYADAMLVAGEFYSGIYKHPDGYDAANQKMSKFRSGASGEPGGSAEVMNLAFDSIRGKVLQAVIVGEGQLDPKHAGDSKADGNPESHEC